VAKLQGQVVSVTDAGDLVTDIAVADLRSTPRNDRVSIRCEGHVTSGIFPTEHEQPSMTFVALEGASGFLELSLVGDDASRFLGIRPGADVSLVWQ
jgi:S-adenosylmethionine hydrolase